MVYDNTTGKPDYSEGERGYSIHDNGVDLVVPEPRYALFSDDGAGNGDYLAGSEDLYWIRRIAYALDSTDFSFDYNGHPKL
jgi:hypothetical protein